MKDIINIKKLIHDYQKYNEDGKVKQILSIPTQKEGTI